MDMRGKKRKKMKKEREDGEGERVVSVSGKRNGRRENGRKKKGKKNGKGKKLERESRRGGREKLVGERMWVGGVSGRREERGKRKKKRK